MKYAIMSDIHGNLEAFKRAVADAKKRKCKKIICLGAPLARRSRPFGGAYFLCGGHGARSTRAALGAWRCGAAHHERTKSGRGGTPPLPHHEACRLLALRGFRSLAPFVQRVLGFSSRRIRFGTLRPYLGTPLRRLLSPSFHGLPLCFSCPSSVRSKSLNGLRIQPFAAEVGYYGFC